MDGKMFARIGAVVFVGLAITASVIGLTRKEEAPLFRPLDIRQNGDGDPMQRQLRQCRDMGPAAIRDPACLKAWVANRARFLRLNTKAPQTSAPAAPTPSVSIAPEIAPDPTAKETAPVTQPEPARPGTH